MSDDLVRRLECYADLNDAVFHPWVYREAADRITDLNFQISVIQGAAAHAKKSYEEHLAVYRQKLEEKSPIWHDDIQSLQERDAIMTDRIEKLEAELHSCFHRIEELQAALRELSDDWPCCDVSKAMREIARKALDAE
jgi:chromosome segregation ATPase